ncbi:MAG: PH domain-containing protein [Candidatus Gracilibacteria bacterium]|nr:PH domain-containing protein [Candidatus Gracilibacteria bacterium]
MVYIESNLSPNEEIIYKGEIHLFYKYVPIIGIVIGFIFMISLGDRAMVGFIIFIFSLVHLLSILSTEIAITNKNIIYKTGIISRNVFELQLSKVESVLLDQSIFERIIGAGTLIISGTGGHNKPIIKLADSAKMKTIIYNEIENNKKTSN